MTTSIQNIYDHIIDTLPPADRLRLATLILNELVQHGIDIIDQSDTWSEQDELDLISFSLQYAGTAYPNQEEIIE